MEKFKNCLLNELRKEDFFNNNKGLERFYNVSMNILNERVPRKKKFARDYQMSLMTKDLSKEIMKKVQTAS